MPLFRVVVHEEIRWTKEIVADTPAQATEIIEAELAEEIPQEGNGWDLDESHAHWVVVDVEDL